MDRLEAIVDPLDHDKLTYFFDSPGEFLVKTICDVLKSQDVWKKLYGDNIDPYQRMDYDIRALPALRIYNNGGSNTTEDWFVDGDIKADSILPASLRRNELQQVQDTLTSALMQQFRSQEFFTAIGAKVPGLNWLGRTFTWDKSLGFDYGGEDAVPLTQITLNFRLDLRIWDDYLVSQGRTKEEPFCKTIAPLQKLIYTIQALRDDGTDGPKVGPSTIKLEGG